MAVTILTLVDGDTAYISKHNTNYANIKAAIEALQSAIGAGGGGGDTGTLAVAYEALFNAANAIIGYGSYLPSDSATAHELTVAAGYAYDEATDAVVTKNTTTTLDFTGQTTGTYYVHVDGNGEPYYDAVSAGALYSVAYDQTTGDFDTVTRTGNLFETSADQEDARDNTWGINYDTQDLRTDGVERATFSVLQKTVVATDITLTDQEAFEQSFVLLNDGPQTANIVFTVPALERIYTINNDCDANYTVTVTPSGGSGYALGGKYFAVLYCDGTTVSPMFLLDRSSGASPVSTFTGLSDSPSVYTGSESYFVKVNSVPNAVEFVAEATLLRQADVDDVPVDAATTAPISSNWAYDHENAADPHPGYLTPAEGNATYEAIDATILRQADVDDVPVDAATTVPISSNWAYDHANAADPHPGYLTQTEADAIYEPDLGNPASDGYILSSTAAGARSWIENTTADFTLFGSISDQSDQATVAAAHDTLYIITTGATNSTCTVNLPTPTSAGQVIGVTFYIENTTSDTVVIHPATGDQIDGSTADITLDAEGQHITLVSDGNGTDWYIQSKVNINTGIVEDSDFTANGAMERTGAGAYTTILNKRDATIDPTTGDDNLDGYSVGSRWINITDDKEFVCLDSTTATAVWTETTGGGTGGGGGFSTVSSQSDQATVSAAVDTLYIITTGATNATCTVSLPATAAAGKTIGVLYLAENATGDKVVIDPGTDSINGSTTDWEMHVPGQYAEFVANGDDANWYNNGYQASRVFVQTTEPTEFKVGDVWIH